MYSTRLALGSSACIQDSFPLVASYLQSVDSGCSYLESETDQSQYDLGTDLKVVICPHHFL